MSTGELREALRRLLGEHYLRQTVHVVLYGSRKPERDIDIVVVQSEKARGPTLTVGRLDLFVIERKQFTALLSLLDPVITEPLLTGELLFGNSASWELLQKKTRGVAPNRAAEEHATRRSFEEYLIADQLWQQYQTDAAPETLRWCLQNLSFSISYASFARHYASAEAQVLSWAQLRTLGKALLPEFWSFYDRVKEHDDLQPASVAHWLPAWARTVLGITQTGEHRAE